MDGKSHKDRLEQFFDQSWDDQKLSQDAGTPDLEDAWDNIQTELNGRRRSPWWLFLLLIPVAFGVGALYFTSSSGNIDHAPESSADVPVVENTSINSSVNPAVSPESELSQAGSDRSSSSQGQNTTSNIDQKASETVELSGPMARDVKKGQKATSGSALNRSKKSLDLIVRSSESESAMADVEKTASEITRSSASSSEFQRQAISPLDFLGSNISLLTSDNDLKVIPPSVGSQYETTFSGWNAEIFIGHGWHVFLTGDSKTNIDQVEVDLENGQYWMVGIAASLEYKNNRNLDVSLGWREHTFTSHYELGVNYTGNGEIQDAQGNWHQGYQHTLPTLFGDTPMEHVLIRGENDGLNEGEYIPFGLFLEHRVEELNLSIGHSWELPVGAWQMTFGANLSGAYWYDKEEIRSLNLVSRHEKVHHNRTEYADVSPRLVRPWYLGVGALMGVQRNIFSNQKVGVRGQLLHPVISPVLHRDIEYAPQFVDLAIFWKIRI